MNVSLTSVDVNGENLFRLASLTSSLRAYHQLTSPRSWTIGGPEPLSVNFSYPTIQQVADGVSKCWLLSAACGHGLISRAQHSPLI